MSDEKQSPPRPTAPMPPVAKKADEQVQPTFDQVTTDSTEVGGRKGPEATRYGDWEKNGRCIDF